MTKIIETSVFTNNAGIKFQKYESGKYAKLEPKGDGKFKTTSIKEAEYNAEKTAHEAWLAEQAANKTDNPQDGADNKTEAKTEKKAKGHATADKFLALIPKDTYIFRTNNKGHILITKADGDKTAYARIRPLKDGAWVFPGKELKATREDWEYHKGWANEYALKVANWDEVAKVLNLEQA